MAPLQCGWLVHSVVKLGPFGASDPQVESAALRIMPHFQIEISWLKPLSSRAATQ